MPDSPDWVRLVRLYGWVTKVPADNLGNTGIAIDPGSGLTFPLLVMPHLYNEGLGGWQRQRGSLGKAWSIKPPYDAQQISAPGFGLQATTALAATPGKRWLLDSVHFTMYCGIAGAAAAIAAQINIPAATFWEYLAVQNLVGDKDHVHLTDFGFVGAVGLAVTVQFAAAPPAGVAQSVWVGAYLIDQMAREVRTFAVTVPAGTPQANPQVTDLTMPSRTVRGVRVRTPPGPQAFLGWALGAAGVPILPWAAGTWMTTDDEVLDVPLSEQINSGSWQLHAWNLGTFDHTLYVTFLLDPVRAPGVASGLTRPLVITA